MPLDGIWQFVRVLPLDGVGYALAAALLVLWLVEGEHPGAIGEIIQRAVCAFDRWFADTKRRRW